MTSILTELAKFDFIHLREDTHAYQDDQGYEYKSVTSFLRDYKKPFPKEFASAAVAKSQGKTQKEVLRDWEGIRMRGTDFHHFADNYFNGKLVFPWIPDALIEQAKLFHHNYIKTKILIPLKTEFVVADYELKLAGTIDLLFFDRRTKKVVLYDWKTGGKPQLDIRSFGSFFEPFDDIKVKKVNEYSLQLSLYKFILQRNTNLELGASYLIWCHAENDGYELIKTIDYTDKLAERIEQWT